MYGQIGEIRGGSSPGWEVGLLVGLLGGPWRDLATDGVEAEGRLERGGVSVERAAEASFDRAQAGGDRLAVYAQGGGSRTDPAAGTEVGTERFA